MTNSYVPLRRVKRLTISAMLLSTTLLGAAVVVPAGSASADDSVTSAGVTEDSTTGWVSYDTPQADTLDLSDQQTTTIAGAPDAAGGCSFHGSFTAASDDAPNYVEETAYNPTTCQEILTSGTLSDSDAAALDDSTANDPASTEDSDGAATDQASRSITAARKRRAAAAVQYDAYHVTTKWIDPAFIDITTQQLGLRWPLYGAAGTLSSSYPSHMFKYDGWNDNGGAKFSGFATTSGNAGWKSNVTAHFTNKDFAALVYAAYGPAGWLVCGAHLSTTANFYHNITITGNRNGTVTYSYNDDKSGACSDLVRHSASTGWSLN